MANICAKNLCQNFGKFVTNYGKNVIQTVAKAGAWYNCGTNYGNQYVKTFRKTVTKLWPRLYQKKAGEKITGRIEEEINKKK